MTKQAKRIALCVGIVFCLFWAMHRKAGTVQAPSSGSTATVRSSQKKAFSQIGIPLEKLQRLFPQEDFVKLCNEPSGRAYTSEMNGDILIGTLKGSVQSMAYNFALQPFDLNVQQLIGDHSIGHEWNEVSISGNQDVNWYFDADTLLRRWVRDDKNLIFELWGGNFGQYHYTLWVKTPEFSKWSNVEMKKGRDAERAAMDTR